MSGPVVQNRTVEYIDEDVRSVGLAIGGSFRWFGWSVFSPISGKIIELFGYNISFIFTSIIYLVALYIFVKTVTKYKPPVYS